jgi:fructose-1,6-bisphosphatase/inositol monophosphatase family enzyme
MHFDCTGLSKELNNRQIRTEEIHSICFFSSVIASGFLKSAFTPAAFIWDRAASSIIIEAAGGIMADENGNSFDPFTTPKYLLISNKDTLPEMVQLARDFIVTS